MSWGAAATGRFYCLLPAPVFGCSHKLIHFDIPAQMRYARLMMPHLPLPAHLMQFVREQLASGRFRSERDVLCAALRLLEEQSLPHETSKAHVRSGSRERLRADDRAGNATPARPGVRRSPRGILADLPSDLGPEDFREARREMWSGFSHGVP